MWTPSRGSVTEDEVVEEKYFVKLSILLKATVYILLQYLHPGILHFITAFHSKYHFLRKILLFSNSQKLLDEFP